MQLLNLVWKLLLQNNKIKKSVDLKQYSFFINLNRMNQKELIFNEEYRYN